MDIINISKFHLSSPWFEVGIIIGITYNLSSGIAGIFAFTIKEISASVTFQVTANTVGGLEGGFTSLVTSWQGFIGLVWSVVVVAVVFYALSVFQ